MLAAIILVIAGLLLIAGKADLGAKALKAAIGLALVLSCLPLVIHGCAGLAPAGARAVGAGADVVAAILLLVVVAAVGFLLWQRRSDRARAREAARRRHGQARARALPPTPRRDDLTDEEPQP